MRVPDLEQLLDVISLACLGDTRVRVDVDERALDDPMGMIGNAVNVLLDDLEYRQREREEALRRVAGMEAKQEFLAYLSHDMQTPMAVLLGAVTVLRNSHSQADVAATLPLMEQAIERLQRFVRQFLDLARLEADRGLVLEVTAMDVGTVVKRVVDLFADDGAIEVRAPAELPPAAADPMRVEQILTNLVANAFKYAKSAPTIELRETDQDTVEVRVVDRGPGLTPDELERVFDKFERGPTANGAGLGLYISRALAEAHGGALTADSVPGEGATFILCLPAAR
ncbi:sensor histidine kinase [Egicoccus sp. AB-alg2]|uniref:sensor histidine kinase n=1 Tax=Egicoccus sp. AB-alg2 TaxID=3242693 RepID=UPI00359E3117